jgi:hypothetical protein
MIDYITSDLFVFWFFLLCLLCLFLIVNMKEFDNFVVHEVHYSYV